MSLPRNPEGRTNQESPEERTAVHLITQMGCACMGIILGILLFGVLASAGVWVIVRLVESIA